MRDSDEQEDGEQVHEENAERIDDTKQAIDRQQHEARNKIAELLERGYGSSW